MGENSVVEFSGNRFDQFILYWDFYWQRAPGVTASFPWLAGYVLSSERSFVQLSTHIHRQMAPRIFSEEDLVLFPLSAVTHPSTHQGQKCFTSVFGNITMLELYYEYVGVVVMSFDYFHHLHAFGV